MKKYGSNAYAIRQLEEQVLYYYKQNLAQQCQRERMEKAKKLRAARTYSYGEERTLKIKEVNKFMILFLIS